MSRVMNFNAGPSMLPTAVLEQVQAELLDYQGRGMSIMEMSHRSKEYEAVNTRAEATVKQLLGLGDGVAIQNVSSKKTIQAVASGPDQALVGPAATQMKSATRAQIALR